MDNSESYFELDCSILVISWGFKSKWSTLNLTPFLESMKNSSSSWLYFEMIIGLFSTSILVKFVKLYSFIAIDNSWLMFLSIISFKSSITFGNYGILA